MQSPKPRRGRPTTQGTAGEKSTLSIRASAELKAKLDAASNQSGRSLSAEAEVRLEQSFRDQQRPLLAAMELAFGRELGGILIVAGEAMARTRDSRPPTTWDFSEPWICDEMIRAARLVLEAFRPAGEIVAPEDAGPPVRGAGAKGLRLLTLGRELEDLSPGEYVARLRLLSLIMNQQGLHDPASSLLSEAVVDRVRAKIE